MSQLVWKFATCNVWGLNNSAKQVDVVCWHFDIGNLVSIFTESKLRDKVRPWITGKFDGVQVFTSGLDSGCFGSGVAIVINNSLAKHVCKISEVPSWLLSIRFLFKNKLSVSVLGLYAGASLSVCFSQTGDINSLIAKAVNKSSFVVLGGDFNEDGAHKSASFKKCSDLGLVNALNRSVLVKMPTWGNSHDVVKTIDYMFISSSLINAVVNHDVTGVEDFFDTDHKAISVSLNSMCKQANKNHWKFNFGDAGEKEWNNFKDATLTNGIMCSSDFTASVESSDLDAMWNIVHKIMILSMVGTFKKKWFKGYDEVFTKGSSRFHKLELLVFKLVKASRLLSSERLDINGVSVVKSLFLSDSNFNMIRLALVKARKSYHSAKLLEFRCTEESCIRAAIDRRMESFESDKSCIIRSVLEHPFYKMVLDHLVVGNELILEPSLVKARVDGIMEGWTRKCKVVSDISDNWSHQYKSLEYVFDGMFSGVICFVGFNKLFSVVSGLPEDKAAGLSGILNKLWKHYNKSILNMFLVLLNFCLICESVSNAWKEAWTAHKILSKILSDRISLACSTFDVLCGNNFSVLKSMTTQSPIFAIGSVIEDALKKNCELWLIFLVRIKMCSRFIRFFGSIHNGYINRVMTDFGLTDEYEVHDDLDQGKRIFYDPLLCEVKRQADGCGYRLNSHFIFGCGRTESWASVSSFFTVDAFVDNTIWVGSSQSATQYILTIANKFFDINNISINNDKTVAIPINCDDMASFLLISESPISIAKKGELHCYLEIYLSTEGLLKSSLTKTYSDVWFFSNLVLKKAVSNKQFSYLVLAVLFPIIGYRTQFSYIPISACRKWDTLIHKGLRSKSGLPRDFPNDAIYHLSLYGLKTFKQVQAESKLASVVSFANSVGILECLFSHQLHDLQVLCWRPLHSLQCLVCVKINPLNNFLAGVMHIFSGCDLLLGGSLSCEFGIIGASLFDSDVGYLSIYTNGSLSNLGTVDIKAGAAVFFEDIGMGLDVGVSDLMSSTLTELKTIALVLKCVPSSYSINLFSNSQAALDACKLEMELVCPDFRNWCWIKCHHIVNIICCKNLKVNWYKVKRHLEVLGNEWTDKLAKTAAFSGWHLPHSVNERYLRGGGAAISGNFRHFVQNVFWSVHRAHWEISCGTGVMADSLHTDIDWFRLLLVWHLDSHMAAGFTSKWTAGFWTYFMKTLHHRLPVTVHKRLYDKHYPSVMCLFCGDVEVSNHAFSCPFDADGRAQLLNAHAAVWSVCSSLAHSSLSVLQLLSTCVFNVSVSTALYKSFVFKDWFCKSVSVFKDSRKASQNIVVFVCKFSLAFWEDIWLVCAKHCAFMEKNGLILCNESAPVPISGLSLRLSSDVTQLLGVAKTIGIGFKFRLFFSGIEGKVSVHISA
ncbi:hypothetical protein G9A89_005968 [Geosiphon pyriformis]|nr:hypothetical protein G9A89_005968 [Geosiphon pyriformis]